MEKKLTTFALMLIFVCSCCIPPNEMMHPTVLECHSFDNHLRFIDAYANCWSYYHTRYPTILKKRKSDCFMLLDSDINFNFKEDGWSVYMNGEKIKHVNSQKIHKKINVFDISLIKTKQKFHNDTLRCVINNKTDTLLDVSFLLDEGFLYSRVDSLYDEPFFLEYIKNLLETHRQRNL